jgi:hypothetical protein
MDNPGLIPLLDERVQILDACLAQVMHHVSNSTLSKKLLNWACSRPFAKDAF